MAGRRIWDPRSWVEWIKNNPPPLVKNDISQVVKPLKPISIFTEDYDVESLKEKDE